VSHLCNEKSASVPLLEQGSGAELLSSQFFKGSSFSRLSGAVLAEEAKQRKKGAHHEKVHNLTDLNDLAWLSFPSLVFYKLGGSICGSYCVGPTATALKLRGERVDDGLENRGDGNP